MIADWLVCDAKGGQFRGAHVWTTLVLATSLSFQIHVCLSLILVGSQPATVIPWGIGKHGFPNESGKELPATGREMLGMFYQPLVNSNPLLGWRQGLGERQN